MQEKFYITKQVKNNITTEMISVMIEMVKEIEVKKDYLQVFRIKNTGNGKSLLMLSQEVPSYEKSIIIDWVAEQEVIQLFYINNVLMMANEY